MSTGKHRKTASDVDAIKEFTSEPQRACHGLDAGMPGMLPS
ncbi:MAG TPA: hypothetical protein VEF34_07115 [Syntrophobacteraceae bacterium]|nr:hypothetical protein [Syntrophobacteraceae bacterium]